LYDQAIARDPSLSAAWSGRAGNVWVEFILDYKADRTQLLTEMDRDSAGLSCAEYGRKFDLPALHDR